MQAGDARSDDFDPRRFGSHFADDRGLGEPCRVQFAARHGAGGTHRLAPSDGLTVAIRAVDGAPKLKYGVLLRAMLGTAAFDARLRLRDRDVLERSGLTPPDPKSIVTRLNAKRAVDRAKEREILAVTMPLRHL